MKKRSSSTGVGAFSFLSSQQVHIDINAK